MTSTGRPAPAWYPDPSGRHQHRYWDGERWTVHVADNGVTAIDGGAAQQPVVQQQVVHQPVVQQPVVPEPRPVTTQWQPTPSPGWAPSARPTPAAAPEPARSSKARGWIVALAFAVAIGAAGLTAVLALGRDDDSSGTSATSGSQRFPTVVESNFMSGCTSTGGNVSYCRCALDHLEQDYDLADLAEAEQSFTSSGKLPDSMVDAIRDCIHYMLPTRQQ